MKSLSVEISGDQARSVEVPFDLVTELVSALVLIRDRPRIRTVEAGAFIVRVILRENPDRA